VFKSRRAHLELACGPNDGTAATQFRTCRQEVYDCPARSDPALAPASSLRYTHVVGLFSVDPSARTIGSGNYRTFFSTIPAIGQGTAA
jgi:hypothetical protein